MRKLEGGFINNVFLENGIVIKIFSNDNLVGTPSHERLERERRALSIFGGTLAPRLISNKDVTLHQEFIEGESYETMARQGEKVFEVAGSMLAKVHRFKFSNRIPPSYYLGRFEKAIKLARPVLNLEQIFPRFEVAWDIVYELGMRYIHEFADSEQDFWRCYGFRPNQETINSFLILRCIEFLATVTLENYLKEEKDGFYHNKITTLGSLI